MTPLLATFFTNLLLFSSAMKSVEEAAKNVTHVMKKLQMNETLPARIASSTFDRNANRKTISFLAAINYAGAIFNVGPICTQGIQMALDNIKRTARNLDNYEVVVDPFDDMCSRPVTVSKFVDAMRRNSETVDRFPLMIGSHCAGQYYTGQMLQHFNFISIIYGTVVADIYKYRNVFRNNFVLTPSPLVGYTALGEFFSTMAWHKFAIISESSEFFHELENQMVASLTDASNGLKPKFGIVNLPYMSGIPIESVYIQGAMEELRPMDARIILIDTTAPSRVACWLHRYKMFGPNYALFVYTAFMFSSGDSLRITEWCTESMLKEVLQSVFPFGVSDKTNLFGDGVQDSTGMTGKELIDALNRRIDSPSKSPYWWWWKSVCYDLTIAAGFLLDGVEGSLQQRNQTLSDWLVYEQKFQQNGLELVGVMKDSLFSLRFDTLSGEVMFDRNTTLNAGNVTVVIFQMQDSLPVPVAVKEGAHKLKLGPHDMKWRTASGRPPIDSIHVIQVLVSSIAEELYIFIIVSSCLLLDASVLGIYYQIAYRNKNPRVKNSVPVISCLILVGNVLFQISNLVQPWEFTATSNANCMAAYGFLFVGMACLVSGLASKLSLKAALFNIEKAGEQRQPARPSRDGSRRHQRQSQYRTLILSLPFESHIKISVAASLVMIIGHSAITVALFVVDPFTIIRVNSTLVLSPSDDSLAFQTYYYECNFGSSPVTTGIVGYFFVAYTALLFRSGFLAYITRQKNYEQVIDSRNVANCLYGTVVMLGCGGITAGAIFANNPTNIRLTISFTLFLLSGLNLCTIFLPQLAKPEQVLPANQRRNLGK